MGYRWRYPYQGLPAGDVCCTSECREVMRKCGISYVVALGARLEFPDVLEFVLEFVIEFVVRLTEKQMMTGADQTY